MVGGVGDAGDDVCQPTVGAEDGDRHDRTPA